MDLLFHFLQQKNAVLAGNKCGRAAPATLIPSRAKVLDMSIKVGLNVSNIMTSDSIIVTESFLFN